MSDTSADILRAAYRTRLCHIMAMALSRLTGLPLGLIVGERLETGSTSQKQWGLTTEYDYGHAVVVVDADRAAWLDVDGIHVGFGAAAFRFSGSVDRVMILPATEESVAMAFNPADNFQAALVSMGDINSAFKFIFADAELTATIESLKLSSKVAIAPDRPV
jgi:hypothetical protein